MDLPRVPKIQGNNYIRTRTKFITTSSSDAPLFCSINAVLKDMVVPRIDLLPRDLIEWRKAKGISLPQIAQTTKISLRYLEAIERGAFDKLPGGVYTASYIHQYARAVDDANNALWDYYRNVFVPKEVPPVFTPEPESRLARLRKMVRSFLGLAPKPAADLERKPASKPA